MVRKTKNKARARKRVTKKVVETETDSTYFLKITIYLILGSQWLYITGGSWQIPIPVGLIVGLVFATHDHFRIDRKIEYVLLIIATFVAFWLPLGLEIKL